MNPSMDTTQVRETPDPSDSHLILQTLRQENEMLRIKLHTAIGQLDAALAVLGVVRSGTEPTHGDRNPPDETI